MIGVALALALCVASLMVLFWLLRREQISLGLPLAYLIALLLIHVPGGWAVMATNGIYGGSASELGFLLTTLGVCFYVVGVALARPVSQAFGRYASQQRAAKRPTTRVGAAMAQWSASQRRYWVFCLLGGWFFVYVLSALLRLPSIGAAIEKGGALWMLGVMLALAYTLRRRSFGEAALWGSALLVYPTLMLLLGGFLSYGSTTVIIVGAFLLLGMRGYWRAALILTVATFLAISLFVNYFAVRKDLRDAVWGGAAMSQRLDVVVDMFANFKMFSAKNPAHLTALDKRLNQNYFVGVAADRLDRGHVDYLYGRSIKEGMFALVPRILWPDKPVYGGSPEIVREMTGLDLNINTSWGVGNVMEFYINFGRTGLVAGFLILGILLGILDRQAALALREGRLGDVFLFFLPAVALIQPNGSLVELAGGGAAALVAGFFWRWALGYWTLRQQRRRASGLPNRLRP